MKIRLLIGCILVGFLACHSTQEDGSCQNDEDCKQGVCVFSKCQECAQDSDCRDQKVCEKNQCIESSQSTVQKSQQPENTVTVPVAEEVPSCTQTGTVYFDFNVYELKPDGRDLLTELAGCLRSRSDSKITVAGNADERGTVEYNLALGEKRAKVAADYLQKSGIDASRMTVISYGKERPVDPAHNEEAWAKNRRTDITLD